MQIFPILFISGMLRISSTCCNQKEKECVVVRHTLLLLICIFEYYICIFSNAEAFNNSGVAMATGLFLSVALLPWQLHPPPFNSEFAIELTRICNRFWWLLSSLLHCVTFKEGWRRWWRHRWSMAKVDHHSKSPQIYQNSPEIATNCFHFSLLNSEIAVQNSKFFMGNWLEIIKLFPFFGP